MDFVISIKLQVSSPNAEKLPLKLIQLDATDDSSVKVQRINSLEATEMVSAPASLP
jgi:hypothetical protein